MKNFNYLLNDQDVLALYDEYRLGDPLENLEPLNMEPDPEYVEALTSGAFDLLNRQQCLIHSFSDAAVRRAAGVHRLVGSTLEYLPTDDMLVFTRLYDARTRVADIVRMIEMEAIADDYDDVQGGMKDALFDATPTEADMKGPVYERHKDVFRYGLVVPGRSVIEEVWDGGRVSPDGHRFLLADVMTAGEMIRHDLQDV